MKIKEFATVINGATPSSKCPEYYGGDIVWFTPKDLSEQNTKYISHGERNITSDGLQSCSAKILPAGSVLMSSRAPIGLLAIATAPCCTNQGFKSFVVDTTLCDSEYLYYYLRFHMKEIVALGGGTTFKEVSKEAIEEFDVELPPLPFQHKIIVVLSALDAKIDNNNAIAVEQEGMAKDLYDYWFVQFDFPDENGKPYKSSGGKMVWNEELKREIPEGWEVDRMGKVCDTLLGGTPDTENALYWNGDIPWLNSGEVATSPVLNAEKTITKEGLRNSATSFASAGAVVMSITGYIRTSILGIDACFNQSVIAVIPNEQIHSTYLYLFMLSQVERYMRLRTGAQQPHINKETVDSTLITLPIDSVLNQFYDRVEPLFERQMIAMKEAKELESLRDFLLPMLMNGQVKVKGA